MAALEELTEVLEKIKETFMKANVKRDEAIESHERASMRIEDAHGHVEMAEDCKDDVRGYIGEIEKLIEAVQNGEDELEDDKIAQEAAEACEKAEKEGKQALEDTMAEKKVVAEKAVGIEE
jgi:uncharacterized coiled-coil DUF342 family protein